MKFDIIRDDGDLVQRVIKTDHYLKRYPDPRSLPFSYRMILPLNGAFVDCAMDGRPWGIVTFKKPQHLKQRGLFGYANQPTHWQVLDLARVWIHPVIQQLRWEDNNRLGVPVRMTQNVFSQMVSLAIRRVQFDWLKHHPPVYPHLPYHIRIIISYCDLSHHDGTAYRASGFRWIGYTSDRTKEVYARELKQPKKSWQPERPAQPPLFDMIDGERLPYIHVR